jgi:hypothetical protein
MRAFFLFSLFSLLCSSANAQSPSNVAPDRLTASAQNGDADAQFELGMRFYQQAGPRHPENYAQAMTWFQRSADQDNAQAQDRIGVMYYFGQGVPRDYEQAAHWYLLAAQNGNQHAQTRLVEMYDRGLGVPRDHQESRRWARLLNKAHPDKSVARDRLAFGVAFLAVLAFALGLAALQRHALSGWASLLVGMPVHAAGIFLVLNTLVTYGFWIVFPHCQHDYLATACTQIADPDTRHIVNQIGDYAMTNLIWRFMAVVGLALDGLAIWYVVYLCQLFFKRSTPVVRPRPVPAVSR